MTCPVLVGVGDRARLTLSLSLPPHPDAASIAIWGRSLGLRGSRTSLACPGASYEQNILCHMIHKTGLSSAKRLFIFFSSTFP